jgi:hypothetical protein
LIGIDGRNHVPADRGHHLVAPGRLLSVKMAFELCRMPGSGMADQEGAPWPNSHLDATTSIVWISNSRKCVQRSYVGR